MTTTRTRRGVAILATLLMVFALVPAAVAETASQDQTVSVTAIEPGILSIGVDDNINFGDVYPGQYTGEHTFGTNYTNTLESVAPWSATVTATEFVRYEWDDATQQHVATSDTFSYTNLTVFPGYDEWAATEHGVEFGLQANFAGTLATSDPVTLFTAPAEFRGGFGTPHEDQDGNLAAWLELFVPAETAFGVDEWRADYVATLTYTITG